MKPSNKGFGVIEGLIVVIALGLLVLGGMWIMSRNDDTNSNSQQTTTTKEPKQPVDTEQPAEQPEGIDTSGWTVFDNEAYSIRIPDGWGVAGVGKTLVAGTFPEYRPGVPGEITEPMGLVNGRFEVLIAHKQEAIGCNDDSSLDESDLTFAGYKSIKCKGVRNLWDEIIYPFQTYEISNSQDSTIEAQFAESTEDGTLLLTAENTELIEAMLNTIQFK